jgi:GH35 family endo-1,4-beta-xylanase
MNGHTVVGYGHYPASAPNDPQGARLKIRDYETQLISHYRGVIDRWVVVNEALRGAVNAKNGIGNWMRAEGIVPAIGEALQWARAANPKAKLIVNESAPRSPATLELFADLVKAHTDFDIIGLQSHMHREEWPLDEVWSLCESYARLGKIINFTEVTVVSGQHGWNLPKPWPSTPDGEARQADYVEKLYTVLFSHPDIEAITWWDLMDGGYQGAPGGLVHTDLSPKPAYTRLLGLIKGKWWTNREMSTGADGSSAFRGFLGDYKVTVITSGGQRSESFTLQQGQNNWSVRL